MADDLGKDFKMSYADLIVVCDNVHSSITRDAAVMAGYGITPLMTSAFKVKIDEFLSYPSDTTLMTDLMSATHNKNVLANNLRIMARTFGTRAKLAFANDDGKYEKFVLKDLSHATDGNLLLFCERICLEATKFLPEFAVTGLTQDMIDDLMNKRNELRTAMIVQEDAVKLRDETANIRVKKANELYRELNKYTTIGKTIWYEVNEALYNDYVIYDYSGSSSSGGGGSAVPAAPENLSVDVNTMIFSWSSTPNTQNYTLEKSAVGIEWEIIYTGPDNFFMYVPETEGLNVYRVKGSNSIGSGLYSSMMSYNYVVPIPAPGYLSLTVVNAVTGEVALNWEEIAEADFFRVYVCSVATGAPAVPADYSLAGEFTVATFTATFGTGMRKYFYVKSGTSGGLLSSPSDSVYADL